jgi:malonyl-CoA O-methyltransferase
MSERPPTIDPTAAARWVKRLPVQSPWLHEEVARRMEQRLRWIAHAPRRWLHWEPLLGGVEAHGLLTGRYPDSEPYVALAIEEHAHAARKIIAKPWWTAARWTSPQPRFDHPAEPVDMLWANMALHLSADPAALLARWHSLLAVDGFLMFSCFGPDTLRELRRLYAQVGWQPPSHEFTDMHDWGDMLVQSGFAEPVMDMERITLSYSSPQTLITELRGLGRNLHIARFQGLRGRRWMRELQAQMSEQLTPVDAGGRLQMTFEVIYGHAFKPAPRLTVTAETHVTLDEMRKALSQVKKI